MYFLPVSELLAVTVTPGNDVVPAFTIPAISPKGDAMAGAACAGAVADGAVAGADCARLPDTALSRNTKSTSPKDRWPRIPFSVVINFLAVRTAEVSPLPGSRHCVDGRRSALSAQTNRFSPPRDPSRARRFLSH